MTEVHQAQASPSPKARVVGPEIDLDAPADPLTRPSG